MTISILGCGWLGLPLGKFLMEKGWKVKGSTTQENKLEKLQNAGIQPYLLSLEPELHGDSSFFSADLLIINIPPRNREDQPDFHKRQLLEIRSRAVEKGVSKILFISSTAVYPNLNRVVREDDATIESLSRGGISLLEMERIFTQVEGFKTTVLRFGGLYGPGRHPGRFLAGKTGLAGADNPVNMIHLEDCIGVITAIVDQGVWGEVFNACSPDHPGRKSFYERAAKEMGLEPPKFSDEPAGFKEVSMQKLLNLVNYTFRGRL